MTASAAENYQVPMEGSLKLMFQQEYSKMVAVISRLFGLEHIETAEDIVSETFLQAAETWGMKGLPPNPTAWLYAVAKQKALYHFRRKKIYDTKVMPNVTPGSQQTEPPECDFSLQNIRDSQLQMLFAVCTPAIAGEAQIGLALRILCGFSIDEIAEAFLSRKDTINKRLFRAKEKLRTEKIKLEMPPAGELPERLGNVLHIIYLLFNEGYYSRTHAQTLRQDLCYEALRLGVLLTEYEQTNVPETNALMALMCFHASRFGAREPGSSRSGDSEPGAREPGSEPSAPVLYEEQNEALWDTALIAQGMHFLDRSMQGNAISPYHLEARIASWHCIKEDTSAKWEAILALYDQLLEVNYSPSAALNRLFAFYKVKGPIAALSEAEKFKMDDNHFYFILLGELYRSLDPAKTVSSFRKAYALAKTETEKQGIRKRLEELDA